MIRSRGLLHGAGDAFLVVTGSSQPKIFDREGHELGQFVKGDMYIRDLKNTRGHQYRCCSGQWHPTDRWLLCISFVLESAHDRCLTRPHAFETWGTRSSTSDTAAMGSRKPMRYAHALGPRPQCHAGGPTCLACWLPCEAMPSISEGPFLCIRADTRFMCSSS